MTRSSSQRISAIAVVLIAASSVAEGRHEARGNRARDAPPRATMTGQMDKANMAMGWSPKPTAAPKPRRAIGDNIENKLITSNDENTCGYVDGIETSSLYCDADSICVADASSQIGCCPTTDTNCDIWTTCINSSEGAALSTYDADLTVWCAFEEFPECVTHVYYDTLFSGYSLYGCGATESVDSVYYLPTEGVSDSAYTPGDGSPNPTAPPSSSSTSDSDSDDDDSSSTGAIVGGVVGGAGAVALVGLAFLFWKKRSKKNADATTTTAANNAAANNAGASGFVAGGVVGGAAAGGIEKTNDCNSSPSPLLHSHNSMAPGSMYSPPPQSPMQQQQYQQQPGQGMMMNNGMQMGAGGSYHPPSAPGSPAPPGSHLSSVYGAPPAAAAGAYNNNNQQPHQPYHSGVPSQYGNQQPGSPALSAGYPSPAPAYAAHQQQQHSGGGAAGGGYGQPGWANQQQQQPQQQGFIAELPTEKGHGEVSELP